MLKKKHFKYQHNPITARTVWELGIIKKKKALSLVGFFFFLISHNLVHFSYIVFIYLYGFLYGLEELVFSAGMP